MQTLTAFEEHLAKMSLAQVMATMVAGSGKPWEAIGRECGWTEGVTNRIRDCRDDSYTPGAAKMESFQRATASDLYSRWLTARLAVACGVGVGESEPLECTGLLSHCAGIFREVGQLGHRAGQAIEDGVLDATDLRRIRKELLDVMNRGFTLLNTVEAACLLK